MSDLIASAKAITTRSCQMAPVKMFLMLGAFLSLNAWAAGTGICTLKAGVLQIAVANTFPPVVMTDKNNKLIGTDVQFLSRFAKENKLKVEWVIVPFAGIWTYPATGGADLAANGLSPLESRKTPGMHFSEPYYRVKRSLLIRRADTPKYGTIADFAGQTVGYIEGSIPEFDLKKRAPKTTTLVSVPGFAEGIEALTQRKVEAVGEGDVTSNYCVKDHPEFAVIDVHEYDSAAPEYLTFAVRDKGCALGERLDAFIKTRAYPSGALKRKTS